MFEISRGYYTVEQALKAGKLVDSEFSKNTVMTYRSVLIDLGLCSANELIRSKYVGTMKMAIAERGQNETWSDCFRRVLMREHLNEIPFRGEFRWMGESYLQYLTRGLQTGNFVSREMDLSYDNHGMDLLFFEVALDNFVRLGNENKDSVFAGSRGTDGSMFNYRIDTPNGDIYYLFSKLNASTGADDMHLFVCKGGEFSPASTEYLGVFEAKRGSPVWELLNECPSDNNRGPLKDLPKTVLIPEVRDILPCLYVEQYVWQDNPYLVVCKDDSDKWYLCYSTDNENYIVGTANAEQIRDMLVGKIPIQSIFRNAAQFWMVFKDKTGETKASLCLSKEFLPKEEQFVEDEPKKFHHLLLELFKNKRRF